MGLFTGLTNKAINQGISYTMITVLPIVLEEVQKMLPELAVRIKERLDAKGKRTRRVPKAGRRKKRL